MSNYKLLTGPRSNDPLSQFADLYFNDELVVSFDEGSFKVFKQHKEFEENK